MPATMTYRFFDYTLRPAGERDFLLAEDWVAADPYHRGIDPLFWLDQGPRSESYLLSDQVDGPIFFFKMQRTQDPRVIELHIQFPPPAHYVRKNTRLMLGLVIGLEWLESVLIESGISTVFFESQNPRLTDFCTRRLGFATNGKWLVKTIRGAGDVRTYPNTGEPASRAS